jgi:catechol 2,3-dioxygenase-like lactoylglutathione lyase family enzyme
MKLTLLLVVSGLFAADNLPIGNISHVGFRVADLEKTRAFYTGMLHIQEAFNQKDASGKITLAVFKINDNQFLEFSPGAPVGFTHLAFLTQKLETLRQLIETLGLNPPELRTGRDRTRNFSIQDPDKHRIEFVQYESDSMQAQSRGKFRDPAIAVGIDHIGLPVADREVALAFFQGKLGFEKSNHSVELLPAEAPVHLCISATSHMANNGGSTELYDPDGIKVELLHSAQ